jgi:hypothetical protein
VFEWAWIGHINGLLVLYSFYNQYQL